MQEVALHLQVMANARQGPDRDAFARSAYNRYYYACFLEIRATLKEMSLGWSKAPHNSYPDILTAIAKDFRAERERAFRLGDGDLS
jgi:hypothetical protein